MHYLSVFVKRIFRAVLLLGLLISVSCPVFAAEGDIRIDETKSLLEDSDTSGEGYLRVEAATPVGFEGTLCVELRRGFSKSVTIQLSPYEYYISGQYLEPGTYTVKKAYALNDASAIVTADPDEVVIDTDGDVLLQLTVTTDPKEDEEWLAMMETYTYPELPSDPVTEATEPAEESTDCDTVPVTTAVRETAPIETVSSGGTTALGLLKSMVVTAILGLLFYLLVKKLRELHSDQ